jgi:hypothetical protein
LVEVPKDRGLVHAPVNLSVYVLSITVVSIMVVAHISNLTSLIPGVRGASALVSLRRAVAIVAVSNIPVTVDSIFLCAPVFNVVRIGLRDSSENSIFVNLVVSLYSSNSPVVGLLSDKGIGDLIPRE